jgi:hypothetical protein
MLGVILVVLAQVEPATNPPLAAAAKPRTEAILAMLEEPAAMNLPAITFLDNVLEHIKRATKKGSNDPGVPIYIDPVGLERAERTLHSMVRVPTKAAPLSDILGRGLRSLGMAYIVKDGLLIISDPRGIARERAEIVVQACDSSPESQALLARLEEPIKMPFPDGTPLRDVLAYLKQATGKAPRDRAIEILVSRIGLEEAGQTLDSTIHMDLEGVALKTTLRLLLHQLGLACVVKQGRLVIHTPQGIRKLMRTAEDTAAG